MGPAQGLVITQLVGVIAILPTRDRNSHGRSESHPIALEIDMDDA
jgi:hypothetical protein